MYYFIFDIKSEDNLLETAVRSNKYSVLNLLHLTFGKFSTETPKS